MKKLIAIIALILFAIPLAHAKSAFVKLANAKTIKCSWGKGVAAIWKNSKLKIELTQFSKTPENCISTFDSINLESKTARVVSNIGASDVIIIVTGIGLTLIEIVPNGALPIVTIFAEYESKSNKFKAVYSRHTMLPIIGPTPQQYYGVCEILE